MNSKNKSHDNDLFGDDESFDEKDIFFDEDANEKDGDESKDEGGDEKEFDLFDFSDDDIDEDDDEENDDEDDELESQRLSDFCDELWRLTEEAKNEEKKEDDYEAFVEMVSGKTKSDN